MNHMNPDQKVAAAREQLIIDQRFFGSLICSMPCVSATRVRGFAVRTMATDGTTIWYNPGFVEKLTLAEVKGVLMHEVMHKAQAHHLRRNGRDHKTWNKACDYAINPIVAQAGQILPAGALINPAFADWSAEEVFEQLTISSQPGIPLFQPEKGDKSGEKEGEVAGMGGDDGSDEDAEKEESDLGDGDEESDEEDSAGNGEDNEGNDAGGGDGDDDEEEDGGMIEPGGGADHGLILDPVDEQGKQLSPADIEAALAEVQIAVLQAAMAAQGVGQLPAGLERIVEEARNPREDWREVLRRFVSQHVETPVDQTWTRPNRRFVGAGQYLPGWRKEDTGDLLLVIDTSGSTFATPALPRFYAEIKRILEDVRPASVHVIWCDNYVQKSETYTEPSEIPPICPGCGGTAFSPVWREVQRLGLKPSGCVFFTDLICHDWGADPGFPVLWAKWGHDQRKPPFGEVLDINQP